MSGINAMDNTVIACVDGSSSTRAVCEYAAWVAGKLDVPLALLHVLEVLLRIAHAGHQEGGLVGRLLARLKSAGLEEAGEAEADVAETDRDGPVLVLGDAWLGHMRIRISDVSG